MDISGRKADRAVERFSENWAELSPEGRQLAEEITRAVEYVGGRSAAADVMQVGVSSIDNYRAGKRQPKALELLRLLKAQREAQGRVEALEAAQEYETLLEKRKEMQPLAEAARAAAGKLRENTKRMKIDHAHGGGQSTRSIPYYEVQVSAGGGALVQSQDAEDAFVVGRDWLSKYLPPNARCGIVEARGDSMEPTIRDGDILLLNFDVSRAHVDAGGVFVITVDDALLVKRLQVMLDGSVMVISDNDLYQAEKVSREVADERMVVHAQVVWVGGPIRKR